MECRRRAARRALRRARRLARRGRATAAERGAPARAGRLGRPSRTSASSSCRAGRSAPGSSSGTGDGARDGALVVPVTPERRAGDRRHGRATASARPRVDVDDGVRRRWRIAGPAGARDCSRASARSTCARRSRRSGASRPGSRRPHARRWSCARPRTATCSSFGAALGDYMWTVVADAAEHLGGGPVGRSTRSTRGGAAMRDLFRKRRMWRAAPRAQALATTSSSSAAARTASRPPTTCAQHGITDVARARAELHRLGRGRAQHDDPALQLQDARGRPLLRRLVKLYEGLGAELDFNLLFSQRGHLTLAHTDRAMFVMAKRAEVNRLHGIDSRADRPRRDQAARAGDVASAPGRHLSDHGRALPPAGRDHPPRRGRLGVRARRRRAAAPRSTPTPRSPALERANGRVTGGADQPRRRSRPARCSTAPRAGAR